MLHTKFITPRNKTARRMFYLLGVSSIRWTPEANFFCSSFEWAASEQRKNHDAREFFNLKIIIGWNWPWTIIKRTMWVAIVKMNDSHFNWPILGNTKRYKLNSRTKTLFAQIEKWRFFGDGNSEHRIGICELFYSVLSIFILWNEIE